MADVTIKGLEDFESMSHEGMTMHMVRAGLGVSSLGIGVVQIPAGTEAYPEHDHSEEGLGGEWFKGRPNQLGQEEVYTALEGSGTLSADGEEWLIEPGTFVRVGPGQARMIVPGPEGLTLLALGGTPGRPYDPS